MKNQLANAARISISNFTFDSKTNTISFFSTKTNKCWSRGFSNIGFRLWELIFSKKEIYQYDLNRLKKLCKNGNN